MAPAYHGEDLIGAIYHGSDAIARVYHGEDLVFQQGGPVSGISVVQYAANSASPSDITLPNAPTPGNYLLFMSSTQGTTTIDAAWTSILTGGDSNNRLNTQLAFYLVQSGDGAGPWNPYTGLGGFGIGYLFELDLNGATFGDALADANIQAALSGSMTLSPVSPVDEGVGYLALTICNCRGWNGGLSTINTVGGWESLGFTMNNDERVGRYIANYYPPGTTTITPGITVSSTNEMVVATIVLHSDGMPSGLPSTAGYSWDQTVSQGDRTATITVTNGTPVDQRSGTIADFVNGVMDTPWCWSWQNDTNNGTGFLKFDLGAAWPVDAIYWVEGFVGTQGIWRMQGSPDDATYTTLGSDFDLIAGDPIVFGNPGDVAYRYYRLVPISGNRIRERPFREVWFRAAP